MGKYCMVYKSLSAFTNLYDIVWTEDEFGVVNLFYPL